MNFDSVPHTLSHTRDEKTTPSLYVLTPCSPAGRIYFRLIWQNIAGPVHVPVTCVPLFIALPLQATAYIVTTAWQDSAQRPGCHGRSGKPVAPRVTTGFSSVSVCAALPLSQATAAWGRKVKSKPVWGSPAQVYLCLCDCVHLCVTRWDIFNHHILSRKCKRQF